MSQKLADTHAAAIRGETVYERLLHIESLATCAVEIADHQDQPLLERLCELVQFEIRALADAVSD
ncbi:hypothetical protein [Hasllibacter sp. MH4015]|uniref:hypothetical protein n=1 Tax=Hasllibacter sp. MH4015 TaxID=2854029 RepID=UPI001CD1C0D3|nr:hypothetical protein [Hasllibacter sp. MH4015]